LHGSLLYSVLELGNFLNISVAQGSVATCLRCGGIFNNAYIAIILLSLLRSAFEEVKGKTIVAPFDSWCSTADLQIVYNFCGTFTLLESHLLFSSFCGKFCLVQCIQCPV